MLVLRILWLHSILTFLNKQISTSNFDISWNFSRNFPQAFQLIIFISEGSDSMSTWLGLYMCSINTVLILSCSNFKWFSKSFIFAWIFKIFSIFLSRTSRLGTKNDIPWIRSNDALKDLEKPSLLPSISSKWARYTGFTSCVLHLKTPQWSVG